MEPERLRVSVEKIEPRSKDEAELTRAGKERQFRLGLTDPSPLPGVSTLWRATAQVATIGMFLIMLIAALYFARPVLLPATTAVVINDARAAFRTRRSRYGVPKMLVSAIVFWLLVVGVFYAVIVLLLAPIGDWITKAPEIGANIREKLLQFTAPSRRSIACASR